MFDESKLDDPQCLAAIDAQLREPATWGAQTRLAMASAAPALDTLGSRPIGRPRAVVAAGRDGRLLRAVVEPTCPVPFVAWPHPGLPGWAGPLDLCVAITTTGEDPESIGLLAEAIRRGAEVIAGCPPDSSVADLVGGRGLVLQASADEPLCLAAPVLSAFHTLGLGPEVPTEAVAAALDDVAAACGPTRATAENPAKEVALVVGDSSPVVWGGSVLAARAARRVAEMLRRASGRPALAGDESQVVPVLAEAPKRDIFADPVLDEEAAVRPALLLLDDGADSEAEAAARERVVAAAERSGVMIHTVRAHDGPEIARFGSLLSIGAFAAAYATAALGRHEAAGR